MKKAVPSSITVEEAVAEMINMDYIPAGLTLLEMMAAFQEEAEVDYENARIDRLPEDQVASLKFRMDSCQARSELAQHLLKSLQYEVNNQEGSMIVLSNDSSSQQRLTLESVSDWASDKYGIGSSRWTHDPNVDAEGASAVTEDSEGLKEISWEDVTIKIWQDYYIKYSFKRNSKTSHFNEIGLMGKSNIDAPNQLGKILYILGMDKKIPDGNCVKSDGKVAISRLRNVLCKWTDLSGDPFIPYNEYDGWKPRFNLKYFSENYADYFAKNKLSEVPFDEDRYSHNNSWGSDENPD